MMCLNVLIHKAPYGPLFLSLCHIPHSHILSSFHATIRCVNIIAHMFVKCKMFFEKIVMPEKVAIQ